MSKGAPREQLRQLLRQLGEGTQVVERRLPALGIARPQGAADELPQQGRLPVGGRAESAEVSRADPV